MYRGKHEMPRKGLAKYKKSHILLVSLLLVLTFGVCGTVAFLMDRTDSVINTFIPSKVEVEVDEDLGETKENVVIQNKSDIPVYVRAKIVVTWFNPTSGEVYGVVPVKDTDYMIDINAEDWSLAADGNYYYNGIVAPNTSTESLIRYCAESKNANKPEGYTLSVEVLVQAIQSDGMGASSAQDAFDKAGGGA